MNDKFLISFALGTLVTISFIFQHICQILFNKLIKETITETGDKRPLYLLAIIIIQMISIGIIVEIINYALNK